MHATAMKNCESFFSVYVNSFQDAYDVQVIDIGSQDVNGSLRQVTPASFTYTGLDFQKANNVDIVLDDPYSLPLPDASVDIVLSSSCFEHSEMFWLVFLEVMRVLKPAGLFYLNVPSAGSFHRYPVDCWRFYPDSGHALVTWAKRNGYCPILLESFTQIGGRWQDYIGVFLKDESQLSRFPEQQVTHRTDIENGYRHGQAGLKNERKYCQNDRKLDAIGSISAEKVWVQ